MSKSVLDGKFSWHGGTHSVGFLFIFILFLVFGSYGLLSINTLSGAVPEPEIASVFICPSCEREVQLSQ